MGEDTDEDDGGIVLKEEDEDAVATEEEEEDQIVMMAGGENDDLHLVDEDHEGGDQPLSSQEQQQQQHHQQQEQQQDQLDMSLEEDLHHSSAEGDLMDTTDQLIDQSIDSVEAEDNKEAILPLDHMEGSELDTKPTELKQEPHEGDLLAAELLQQLHDQKTIIKEEEPTLADEADMAAEADKNGAGLLDTLAQAAALQKVVAVVSPQKKEKMMTGNNSVAVANSNHNVAVKQRRSDGDEGSKVSSANKWYTVGVIQGLSTTVAHFYDWTCDEDGGQRRRRRAESGMDGDKKRRLDVKNGSNGTGGDEDLGKWRSKKALDN